MTPDLRPIFSHWRAVFALVLVASSLVASAKADYTVLVTPKGVTVHLSGDFTQGMPSQLPNTTARPFGDIPVFSGRLLGGNASSLEGLISDAVRARTKGAVVTDLSFSASSNSSSMQYELQFAVNGIFTTNSFGERANLAWRSFSVKDDFGILSVSINKIFQTYLENILAALAKSTSSSTGVQIISRFFMNGQFVQLSNAVAASRNALLLNFSSLNLPLQRWNRTTQLAGPTTLLQSTSGFNLTLSQTVTEAGESATVNFNALNKLNALIEAPLSTTVSNDEITFETSSSSWVYEVMLVIPVACFALFFSSSLWERRIRKRTISRGKKR